MQDYPLKIGELYCSPFKRSLDTTRPVSQRLKLRPTIRADIYEQGGCYSGYEPGKLRGEPGMCCNVLGQLYPEWIIDPLIGPRGWNVDRHYETYEEVVKRARNVRHWLTNSWQPTAADAIAAFVIHADFKEVLTTELLGTHEWPGSDEPIWNTSVSLFQYQQGTWHLLSWNDTKHLPDAMRT